MSDDWAPSDEESDAWLEEWAAVDREAARYLAERIPGVEDVPDDRAAWLDELVDTISPSELPGDDEVESLAAVMALQHVDWLGLALGVVRRGPGSDLDAARVQADVVALDEVDGEIEDPDGHLAVMAEALDHLAPRWRALGVLDDEERLTERGVWALPRALHRSWTD